jgi:lycopene beta-cyclase
MTVARELLLCDPHLSITLFDCRPRLPHPQRTFCFFQRGSREYFDGPTFAWKHVAFRGAMFERSVDVSASPYTMVRGQDLFDHLLSDLESRGVAFFWGSREIVLDGNTVRRDGEPHTFDAVIDAAFDAREAKSILWQSFAGVWITSEQELFNPTTAVLMDLQESSSAAPVSFMYILPTSTHTALVEHTTFSPTPMPQEYHLERCRAWISERALGPCTEGETEYGQIPMGYQRRVPAAGSLCIGTTTGTVRPATGYAFVTSQDQARQVAREILYQTSPAPPRHPWWLTAADTLFLRALRQRPEVGERLMARLLARTQAQALISFLSDDVSFRDAVRVWMSVPKLSMLRSLVRL